MFLLLVIGILFWECGLYEEDCFRFVSFQFVSSADVDSVRFYLNGERICRESAALDTL